MKVLSQQGQLSGTETTAENATVVRIYNSAGDDRDVNILEFVYPNFNVIGTISIPSGQVIYVQKKPEEYLTGSLTCYYTKIAYSPVMQYASWIGGGSPSWNDIDTATYSQQSSWSIPDNPNGVYFKPDGTKIFYAQNESSNIHTIRQADLSTPWDLTTAGSVTYMTCDASLPRAMDIHFNPDGTILYYADFDTDHVVQLSLSTPWDVTTSSLTSSFDIDSQTGEGFLRGLYISPDGEKLFVHGFNNDKIARFTLSTPWDITTGSYHSQSGYICSIPLGLYFKPDGTKVFSTDNGSDSVKQWNLSTPWDITGVVLAAGTITLDVSSQTGTPTGVYIPDDGKYIFVGDGPNQKILRYLLNP